jgi:hypothetical protein
MKKNGQLVAAAVAGFMMMAAPALAADAPAKETKVKCEGINSCKGKGECKATNSDCKGKNTCKGKGMVEVTEKECKEKKGTVVK